MPQCSTVAPRPLGGSSNLIECHLYDEAVEPRAATA
jgi:hypothetical protein